MRILSFPKTLKSRLILYFLVITIVPSVTISYFYFKNSQHAFEKNIVGTSLSNLEYMMTIIDKQLRNAEQLSDWIFINRNLDNILGKNDSNGVLLYNPEIHTFMNLVDYQLRYNSSINMYIYSLLIEGKKGLVLRAGQPEGTQIDITEIKKTDWFQKGLELHGKKNWYGVVENPSTLKFEKYILPLARPVIHSSTGREIGWHMIGFRTNLIADLFKNYEIRPDETMVVIDSRGFCIYHNQTENIGKDLRHLDYIRTILNEKTQGRLSTKINGINRIVTYAKSDLTGWSIVKILSSAEIYRQKKLLLSVTLLILLSSFVFTSFFTVYLSSNLTQPLTKLMQKTKAIADGNFNRDPTLAGEDELGLLGDGINEMAENIKILLEQVIEDEQEKRRLELEVLQNQINPHFLYNTLNSIKLMATIQKADGIKESVTTLGRLLMNLTKNTSEKITLAEEIALLNDYIYIQNIRYKGKIKVEYRPEDPELLNCKIIKFTLQPIVENAIFHGIEPKKDAGQIVIRIAEADNKVVICIEDDGVGMTAAQIENILKAPPGANSRGLSGIGIINVDERIKISYGQGYGLTIESEVGKYTKVYLKIPREE